MIRSVVGFCLVAFAVTCWAEDSMEERLRRLEKLVEQQQHQIGERDAKIQRLETNQTSNQVNSKINTMPAVTEVPKAVDDPNAISVRWNNGLKFRSRNGAFDVSIAGRMQWQLGYMSEDEDTQHQLGLTEKDFVTLRRGMLEASGTMYRNVFWAAQYEFASSGDDDIRDLYMGIKDIPVIGQIRVGNYIEPFNMEELESSRYTQLIERGFVYQAFGTDENFGIELHNSHLNDRMQWAAGVFRVTDGQGNIRQDYNYVGTARVSGLPWWANEGRRHIHLGVAGRVAETSGTDSNETVRFRARPGVRTVNRFLDTGDLDQIVGDARLAGEFTFNWDSFNFAAQYTGTFLNADGQRTITRYRRGSAVPDTVRADDAFLQGYQLTASYLLTGEMRPYDKRAGYYGRIIPKRNLAINGSGFGAVQLVARFQYLDFFDHGALSDVAWAGDEDTSGALGVIGPGSMWSAVGGVNWHLNPNTRIMANYNFINVNREYFDISPTDLQFKDHNYRSHAIVFMFQVDW